MAVKVFDASAIAAVMFDEPEADQIVEELRDSEPMAPDLIMLELADICLRKGRRKPGLRETYAQAFAKRAQFQIETFAVDHDAALRLAGERRLTAYDASYLWLSLHVGAPLVTFDRQLIRASAH